MTYDELTKDLPVEIANAFILSPGYIGADSLNLIHFIETVWKAPVTEKNYKAVAQGFRQWYRDHYPNEYHDPPTAEEMQAAGYDVPDTRWGGARPGAGRKPGPGPRNKPRNPNGAAIYVSVRLDPDVHRLANWHANAREQTFSASINQLLAEALDADRTGQRAEKAENYE